MKSDTCEQKSTKTTENFYISLWSREHVISMLDLTQLQLFPKEILDFYAVWSYSNGAFIYVFVVRFSPMPTYPRGRIILGCIFDPPFPSCRRGSLQ